MALYSGSPLQRLYAQAQASLAAIPNSTGTWTDTGAKLIPHTRAELRRIVELIFTADALDPRAELTGEPGGEPQWLAAGGLAQVAMRPPIAGYLPSLVGRGNEAARYLGNLWRPTDADGWSTDGAD